MYIFAAIAAISLLLNIFFIFYFRKKLSKFRNRPHSKEATELLQDLIAGGAVAVVRIIDPKSIFLWSPKDKE